MTRLLFLRGWQKKNLNDTYPDNEKQKNNEESTA